MYHIMDGCRYIIYYVIYVYRYMPCIYVLNKIDQLTIEELDIIHQLPHHVPISAAHEWNLEELLETIWDYTKMLRIYTKVSWLIAT